MVAWWHYIGIFGLIVWASNEVLKDWNVKPGIHII